MSIKHRFGHVGPMGVDVGEVIDAAQRAEAAGFDMFVMADTEIALAPLVTLAAVAQATSAIGLGTFVLNSSLWSPYPAVRNLATLDQVSAGRLEIGLGTGAPTPAVVSSMPASPGARFERMRDIVDAIDAFVADPPLLGFVSRPRVLVAATGDRGLRLAATRADGFILASVLPLPDVELPPSHRHLPKAEATERMLDRLRGFAGDRADSLELGVGTATIVTDDAERVAAELAEIHTYSSPDEILESPKALIGTEAEIADRVLDRGRRLGFTYTVSIGAEPEELAGVISRVRAAEAATLR